MNLTIQELLDKLQTRIETLENKILEMQDIHEDLLSQIDELTQKKRNHNLIIHGIPESPDESLDLKLQDLFTRRLGVQCDIVKCFRLDRKEPCERSAQTRPVFVKFKNDRDQKCVYYVKNKLKGSNIKIMEDLTVRRLELLKMAKKTFRWNNVWTRNGDIYVYFHDTFVIKSEKDIERIKKTEPIDE
ncbi:hypothetical protein GWI33_007435 [Rhynchophorus ferrugineus]|uniref:Uncharacterized protein n=1 Tax=Rhynchophorus ferrugineus TaxID=354439 RepID=A0A834IDK4_RHYFE|nr:hypothetical protein GWI33_007435 [Rhynchophorus ferrugineus]